MRLSTLEEWVDLFAVEQKVATVGEEVKLVDFSEGQKDRLKAKTYKTPSKKRIRESLDDEEPWIFTGLDASSTTKEKLKEIKITLIENQKEHSHFRECHVELEESISNASHSADYAKEEFTLQISKKPRFFTRSIKLRTFILQLVQ